MKQINRHPPENEALAELKRLFALQRELQSLVFSFLENQNYKVKVLEILEKGFKSTFKQISTQARFLFADKRLSKKPLFDFEKVDRLSNFERSVFQTRLERLFTQKHQLIDLLVCMVRWELSKRRKKTFERVSKENEDFEDLDLKNLVNYIKDLDAVIDNFFASQPIEKKQFPNS
jgi:deoxyadenosine/deoxycytidine kinase